MSEIILGIQKRVNAWSILYQNDYMDKTKYHYTGWPPKNETVDTVDFQDFALINSYFFHLAG